MSDYYWLYSRFLHDYSLLNNSRVQILDGITWSTFVNTQSVSKFTFFINCGSESCQIFLQRADKHSCRIDPNAEYVVACYYLSSLTGLKNMRKKSQNVYYFLERIKIFSSASHEINKRSDKWETGIFVFLSWPINLSTDCFCTAH